MRYVGDGLLAMETTGFVQYHQVSIDNVRIAEKQTATIGPFRPIGIALDTKGPEIRTGALAEVSGE